MISLEVEGMTCAGCANSVKKAVAAADPGATVRVDLATGKVEIESEAPVERLKQAIEGAGYDVRAAA